MSRDMAPVSLIVPTWRRTARTLATLARVHACDPPPAEVLVHVDAGDETTAAAVAAAFPAVRILRAGTPQGPGGGRNRLVATAAHEIVVSLDDDSFPLDADLFAAVPAAFAAHPEAGVLAMAIVHDGDPVPARGPDTRPVADFVGCGCAYRRAAFLATAGYLPLHPAYGMEEADLALQLLDKGFAIVHVDALRIRHATDRAHQRAPRVVAAHVKNTALLAALRYPPRCWPLGLAQFGNRVAYSLRRGFVLGALAGVAGAPVHILRHARHRATVRADVVRRVRQLRRTGGGALATATAGRA